MSEFREGDHVRVRPEHDAPPALRGFRPTQGVVRSVSEFGVVLDVDGVEKYYEPEAIELEWRP